VTRRDADAWLARQQTALTSGTWRDPRSGTEVFLPYAERVIREADLKPKPRAEYERLLRLHVAPAFGTARLKDISPAMVRSWHSKTLRKTPTQRARAYELLSMIMKTAWRDDLIIATPCR
jgi:hypothetical protein